MPGPPPRAPALRDNGSIVLVASDDTVRTIGSDGASIATWDLKEGLAPEDVQLTAPVLAPEGILVGVGRVDLPGCLQQGGLTTLPAGATTTSASAPQVLQEAAVFGPGDYAHVALRLKLNHYNQVCTKGPLETVELSRGDKTVQLSAQLRELAVAPDGSMRAAQPPNVVKGLSASLSELWAVETSGLSLSGPSVGADGTSYVVNGNRMIAIGGAGEVLWDVLVTEVSALTGQPAIAADGKLLAPATIAGQSAGGARPGLAAVKTDGSVAFAFVAPEGDVSLPGDVTCGTPAAADDGRIYLSCGDGRAYCLTGDGALEWSLMIGAVALSPLLSDEGVLYVPTGVGIAAVETESGGLAQSPWPRYRANNRNDGRASSP